MRANPPRWPAPGRPLAVAAPAGRVAPEALENGLAALAELAPLSRVDCPDEVLAAQDYLAGPDVERAAHLSTLLSDPELGAVLAARGGFGCLRLLPLLGLAALAQTGACLIGFSDLTALLNPLAALGLVTVHGPVVTQLPRLDQASRADLAALLAGRRSWPAALSGQALAPGQAAGPLLGGNLTTLCSLLGTPWFPNLGGAVLILEDTGEAPYRLDRMLTQLELAGVLGLVAGVAVGRLSDQESDPPGLAQALARRLAGLNKPVVMNLPFGHGAANRLLPLGATAEISGSTGVLTVGLDLA
ncbi:MAG: LD-carboxypeptidase [Proteobacteria bacterium]|nr:LD-carboxypeptidase [Pseudomonadota bacterium]MBU1453052.1 LD-carboxypeptidase [Pseudomonadota bacterium]